MKATRFKSLLGGLESLTPSQRKKLADALNPTAPPLLRTRSMDALQPHACPHCLGEKVVRNGVLDGLPRYICRVGSSPFNAVTGTPLLH